ncbi:MAG: hypothetical protein ACU84Q_19540 [Gammaproteobacteria bacterium]
MRITRLSAIDGSSPCHQFFTIVFAILMAVPFISYAEITGQHGCERPTRPVIPNGDNTTDAQLIESKQELQNYLSAAETYLACMKTYEQSFGEDIDSSLRVAIIIEHNAVVDEMYLAGDEFNVALRKFNLRSEQ